VKSSFLTSVPLCYPLTIVGFNAHTVIVTRMWHCDFNDKLRQYTLRFQAQLTLDAWSTDDRRLSELNFI